MNPLPETDAILEGNCVALLRDFPPDSIDLTVTSPPYDGLRDYQGYDFDAESVGNALLRVTRPGGVVVWVVGDRINGGRSMTSFPAGGNVPGHWVHRPRCDDLPEKEHTLYALQRLYQLLGVYAGP